MLFLSFLTDLINERMHEQTYKRVEYQPLLSIVCGAEGQGQISIDSSSSGNWELAVQGVKPTLHGRIEYGTPLAMQHRREATDLVLEEVGDHPTEETAGELWLSG